MSAAGSRALEGAARNGIDAPEGTIANVVIQTWCYGNSYTNSIEIIRALGLDPTMTTTELARRIDDGA